MSKTLKALKSLSYQELKAKASELEAQLFKLRLQKVTGQLTNTASVRNTRKELARVKTLAVKEGSQS